MSTPSALARGRDFIFSHGRLLERRILERRFYGGRASAVLDALRAYGNEDGGLGHALEPDLRGPTSQPVHVDFGLRILREVGLPDPEMARRACDFLASVASPDGRVPDVLPSAYDHARAPHWNGPGPLEPALNCTAGIAGAVHWHGIQHPWLDRATEHCWKRLSEMRLTGAHTILSCFAFLENVPDRRRATSLFEALGTQLREAEYFALETPVTRYGLTPLHFAPTPDAFCRRLFSDDEIGAHLDDLASRQQADGGWPIFWEAPGPAAVCEWRGRWTLDAISTLAAWGRLED